jgi:hypothetical protein
MHPRLGHPLEVGGRPVKEITRDEDHVRSKAQEHVDDAPRETAASRYLLTCEALSSTREEYAFTVFERLFKERGLPANIRSDNGVPFASAHALFNLSKLAVWWLRLGIGIERIKPGHPQQNGQHERMHLTLKKEATKPAAANFLQQQARFDKFIKVFNKERPREALDMKCPADVYRASTRLCQGLPGHRLPFPRPNHRGHPLQPHLYRSEKDQFQHGLRRAGCRHQGKCKTTSGWSALWIMIWAISIWRRGCSNRWKIRSAQKCYLCSRYIV